MLNISDTSQAVEIKAPSFWFWVKAGIGFALGATIILPLVWLVFLFIGLGGLSGLARVF